MLAVFVFELVGAILSLLLVLIANLISLFDWFSGITFFRMVFKCSATTFSRCFERMIVHFIYLFICCWVVKIFHSTRSLLSNMYWNMPRFFYN